MKSYTALRRDDSIWKHYRNKTTEKLLHMLYYVSRYYTTPSQQQNNCDCVQISFDDHTCWFNAYPYNIHYDILKVNVWLLKGAEHWKNAVEQLYHYIFYT